MKRPYFPAHNLIVALAAAALWASTGQNLQARDSNTSGDAALIFAATAADGGRLIIKRSPVLADNLGVTIAIDGKPIGVVRRGSPFEHHLAPGRHVLTATPTRRGDPWSGTLDVRAGETYSYVVSYNVNKLVLTRMKSR